MGCREDACVSVLKLQGSWLEDGSAAALAADRLVASLVVLTNATMVSQEPVGAVSLRGAQLGRLECDGAKLRNDKDPALHADSLRVEQDVLLRHGFEAIGYGAAANGRLGRAVGEHGRRFGRTSRMVPLSTPAPCPSAPCPSARRQGACRLVPLQRR
jgi:hypothetical protein